MGINRSGALSIILKKYFKHDVMQAGYGITKPDTFKMLSQWADKIAICDIEALSAIPGEYRGKVAIFNIGDDVYGNPMQEDLRRKMMKMAIDWVSGGLKTGVTLQP